LYVMGFADIPLFTCTCIMLKLVVGRFNVQLCSIRHAAYILSRCNRGAHNALSDKRAVIYVPCHPGML